jgi:hypothetical protein
MFRALPRFLAAALLLGLMAGALAQTTRSPSHRPRPTARPAVGTSVAAAAAEPALPPLRTVCTITVNSADEKEAFRRHLPESQNRFVELVERGRPDWLSSACRAGVRCDVLIVSGHFDGANEFFADDPVVRENLTVDELERVSCSESCPTLFEQLKEVYLFGCNTLNPQPLGGTGREVMHSLVRDGLSRQEAEQYLRGLGQRLGESSRDRMRDVFPDVPLIYGFASFAPLGPVAGETLERFFRAGGAQDVGQGRRSARLLGQFSAFGLAAASGVVASEPQAAARRDMCEFADDRRSDAQRLAFIHRLLQRPMAAVHLHVERIERTLERLDDATRARPEVALRLDAIANDFGARSRFLAFARDSSLHERVRLLDLGRGLGWLSDEHRWRELGVMLTELQARSSIGPGEIDLACTLNRSRDLDGAYSRQLAASNDSVAQAALRACLGSSSARSQTLAGLASPMLDDVQAAQAYLRHHPISDAAELRTVAEAITEMAPSEAQARAVESLGRLYLSDLTVLQRLVQLYGRTPSPAVQGAIAGTLLRADPLVIRSVNSDDRASLLRLLREQRRPGQAGQAMVDALIRQLEPS